MTTTKTCDLIFGEKKCETELKKKQSWKKNKWTQQGNNGNLVGHGQVYIATESLDFPIETKFLEE